MKKRHDRNEATIIKRTSLLAIMTAVLAGCEPADTALHGYVEGEYVRLAATTGGLLETLSVSRGDQVTAGAPLFSLDLTDLIAARAAAEADLARARAEYADLTKGARPEELEIIRRQREQVKANLVNAEKEFVRLKPLVPTGAASQSSLDAAEARLISTRAQLKELDAKLTADQLGARSDRIEAARASVDRAVQALARIDKQLTDATPKAPAGAMVEDTYFRPGEYVAAGQPVVSLLPPENVKVRFYVPQALLPKLPMGSQISVDCDGCNGAIDATISYISSEAEYTPPVIYSVESRDKLVFLVEAKPTTPSPVLRPGLPVDVTLEQE